MIIDSGASCNVLGCNVWEYLKANKVKCVFSKASKKLYSYGSKSAITSSFHIYCRSFCWHGERLLSGVELIVIENKGQALLGRETSITLGVLKLGPPV